MNFSRTSPRMIDHRRSGGRSLPHAFCLLLTTLVVHPGEARAQADGVLITEFMASNNHALADEDGDFSDWIEIQNITLTVINLEGWYLTDDDDNLTKWTFPDVVLQRGESIIVFASDKNRAEPGSQLHTSFKLEASGEFLALVKPDGVTIAHAFSPSFPQQYSDVSFGLAQAGWDLVQDGDVARYHVPAPADETDISTWMQPAFSDSSWGTGEFGMGFVPVTLNQFDVTVYRSSIPVTDLSTAEGVIADPATHISVTSSTAPFINYLNTGGAGRYGADASFPGMTIGVDVNDFVVEVVGTILIPSAGNWTFGVNSDDGFGLTLSRFPHVYSMSFPGLRGAADTLAVFNLFEPGSYEVRLVSFERGGGASLEFFAAPGSFASFSAASFDLVGNVATGGLALAGIADELGTNLESQMHGINSSLWIRREFTVPDPSAIESLYLKVRYEDGFVAYLNGTEVARRNAPVTLTWDAASAADRPWQSAQSQESIDISSFIGQLNPGNNLLAFHALNDSASNGEFFIIPSLLGVALTEPGSSPRYFSTPTPGSLNNAGYPGVANEVAFSHNDATFTDPFTVVLSSATPGALIRYTLDNTDPTDTTGIEYAGPIDVTGSVQIRARAFEPGLAPSPVRRRLYSRLNSDVLSFDSNLPIVVVDTFGYVTTQNWYTLGLTAIRNNPGSRTSMIDAPEFVGATGLKIRGSSSTSFPKKQYAMETWDQDNKDQDVALLGFPGDSDWILYGPYTDKSLMRDFLAYRWSNAIGRYAVRTQYVEVFFDQNGGGVSAGDYAGVYILQEKIKLAPHRVNVAEMSSADTTPPGITGGYILKKDRLDPGDTGFLTNSGQRLAYVYPKETEITTAQADYIRDYLNAFESVLYSPQFADPETGYAAYIDPGSFIDHHIMVEMTKNIDGFRLSTFMYKDRGGKLHMGPVWDYNLTLGNANYLEGWLPTGWYHTLLGNADYPWWNRLFEDPEFSLQYADRWHALRRSQFQTQALIDDIDEIATLLVESQQRNYVKWPILGVYVWPNWFIGLTYEEEVEWMKQWLQARLNWMDEQLHPPPTFNQQGGVVPEFFELAMTASSGSIYYTTDGTDPRLAGGDVRPTALLYDGPVSLTQDSHVVARSRDGSVWSARNEALFDVVSVAVVNEVLPSNTLVNVDEWGDRDPWIEIYNPSTITVDLTGYFLSDDPENSLKWAIPEGTVLCGYSRILIWADGDTNQGPLHASFTLLPQAGSVRLSSPQGQLVDELAWPGLLANQAYGRYPDAALATQAFPVPTPGEENRVIDAFVFLNEYNAVTPTNLLSGSGTDTFWGRIPGNGGNWFEIVIASDHADIRGWQFLLSDDTGGGGQLLQTLTLTQHPIWSDLRAGTIVTVSESLASDIGYDPLAGDWWINVQAAPSASGAFITNQVFETSHRNWQLTIKNALGIPRFGPVGEGVNSISGIGSDEVCKLEENPTLSITPASAYRDGSSSSFGAPNIWSSGTLSQNFSALRNLVTKPCVAAADCNDADDCTTDECINNFCAYALNTEPCDDLDSCTMGDVCSGGLCTGVPVEGCCVIDCDCDDLDPCTMDTCTGAVCNHAPASEADCDDQNPCTESDVCQSGICIGMQRDCSIMTNSCNVGVCNPGTGICEASPDHEGEPCDDQNPCTSSESCQSGQCIGTLLDCSSLDSDCQIGACNPVNGLCEPVAANEGGSCDDANECTVAEICTAGVCSGGQSICCSLSAIGPRYFSVTAPSGHASLALLLESEGLDCLPKYITLDGYLSDTPVFADSSDWVAVAVADQEIVPARQYSVRADIRAPHEPVNLSPAVSAETWVWGDSNHDGGVDLFDVICVLDGFADVFANCTLAGVDLQGRRPDRRVDLFDIVAVLDGFQSIPYSGGDPCEAAFSQVIAAQPMHMALSIASRRAIRGGEELIIDVHGTGASSLRAYQLQLSSSTIPDARVEQKNVWSDSARPDHAFSGRGSFTSVNSSDWKIAVALASTGPLKADNTYLASFRLEIYSSRATKVVFDLNMDGSILLDDRHVAMPFEVSTPLEVLISPRSVKSRESKMSNNDR